MKRFIALCLSAALAAWSALADVQFSDIARWGLLRKGDVAAPGVAFSVLTGGVIRVVESRSVVDTNVVVLTVITNLYTVGAPSYTLSNGVYTSASVTWSGQGVDSLFTNNWALCRRTAGAGIGEWSGTNILFNGDEEVSGWGDATNAWNSWPVSLFRVAPSGVATGWAVADYARRAYSVTSFVAMSFLDVSNIASSVSEHAVPTSSVLAVSGPGLHAYNLSGWSATGSTWNANVAWCRTPEMLVTGRYVFAFYRVGDSARWTASQVFPLCGGWESALVTAKNDVGAVYDSVTLLANTETSAWCNVGCDMSISASLIVIRGYYTDPAAKSQQTYLELSAYRHYAGMLITNGFYTVACPTSGSAFAVCAVLPRTQSSNVGDEPLSLRVRAYRAGTVSAGSVKLTRCARRDATGLETNAASAGWRP